MTNAERLLQAIQTLPVRERLQLVERVVHDLADASPPDPPVQLLHAEPSADASRKLATIRAAAQHDFPTADIDQMLAEIASGYAAVSE